MEGEANEAARSSARQDTAADEPVIYEATRATDGTGAVSCGAELDVAAAIQRRRNGEDVVVCGSNKTKNYKVATTIETQVGRWVRHLKHTLSAGVSALPHLQQLNPPPDGHTFYETENAKARR